MKWEDKKNIVDDLLGDKEFQGIVEKELGAPIKCTVFWDEGNIVIRGPNAAKQIRINDVIDAYRNQETH
jgi:hypothetical protein